MFKFLIALLIIPSFVEGQERGILTSHSSKKKVLNAIPAFVIFSPYITPSLTSADIVVALSLLKQKLKQKGTENIKLEEYKLQLIPSVNEKGEKTFFIKGFCDAPSYWQSELVNVWDGGECYFQATIDLRKRQFLWFSFNGEA